LRKGARRRSDWHPFTYINLESPAVLIISKFSIFGGPPYFHLHPRFSNNQNPFSVSNLALIYFNNALFFHYHFNFIAVSILYNPVASSFILIFLYRLRDTLNDYEYILFLLLLCNPDLAI
jgi:hypothetical protein